MKNIIEIFNSTISLSLIIFMMGCGGQSNKPSDFKEKNEDTKWAQEQKDVKAAVAHFLTAAGNYDLEGMARMISPIANLGVGRFREEKWQTTTMTIDEFFEAVSKGQPQPYFEPVSKYIVHINEGQIAYVWAEATIYKYGIPQWHNIDNFTLIKEDGEWIFINLSYTNKPIPADKKKFDLEIFAKSYAQAWSGIRPDFVASYFTEDGSLRVNDGEPAKGRDAISRIAQGFMTDLPDMVVSFDSLVSKPNDVEFHWTLTATNTGPGGTGNKVKVSGFELWKLENGLIKESQGNFPTEEYNRQIVSGIEKE